MIEVHFSPSFVRCMHSLPKNLEEEVHERIGLFRNRKNHKLLKVHKLKGKMNGCFSFSVDYRTRIVFEYIDSSTAVLLVIGDHSIYE